MARDYTLVTGASGFVGRAVLERMALEHLPVRAASRQPVAEIRAGVEHVLSPDLALPFDWRVALDGVDAVVHCAARVHVMHDRDTDPLAEFRRVNVEGTLELARQAAMAGVRRFVFLSSIKVSGETTDARRPFAADDLAAPADPYGVSKHEAEQALGHLAAQTGMELVVIRPVLVHGPGVKGNFLSMLRWLHRGFPLPLGAIHNLRSLVALDNLVDLILCCLRHPAAANQVFLVSDGEDLSTTALLRRAAQALGRPVRLLPVPALLLRATAHALGQGDVAQRLLGSLQVDTAKTRALLGWSPVVGVDEALRRTAAHFLAEHEGASS